MRELRLEAESKVDMNHHLAPFLVRKWAMLKSEPDHRTLKWNPGDPIPDDWKNEVDVNFF